MAALCLTRRKTQLELLADACRQRQRARVLLPRAAEHQLVAHTRFLALTRNALLLEWPDCVPDHEIVRDATLDIHFEHDDQHFAFRTQSHGCACWHDSPRCCRTPVWKLNVPLCVVRREQRAYRRMSLAEVGQVAARFTSVADPSCTFTAQLTDVSGGGLGGTAWLPAARFARPGDLFWTDFELPEDSQTFEFVVRLVHAQEVAPQGNVALGCTFCPAEDPTTQRDQLRRIEQFLARQEGTTRRPCGSHDAGGG